MIKTHFIHEFKDLRRRTKIETWEANLDENLGLHRPTSTPEDEREEGEEKEEAKNKGKEIVSTREATVAVFSLEKAFFLDDIDVLPWLLGLAVVVDLAGTGEAAGGGLAGVAAKGGGVVGVGRGPHGAEHWSGVERCCGLLAIVG